MELLACHARYVRYREVTALGGGGGGGCSLSSRYRGKAGQGARTAGEELAGPHLRLVRRDRGDALLHPNVGVIHLKGSLMQAAARTEECCSLHLPPPADILAWQSLRAGTSIWLCQLCCSSFPLTPQPPSCSPRPQPGFLRGRLPPSAPEQPEPFDAVLRDLHTTLMPGGCTRVWACGCVYTHAHTRD